MEEKESRLLKFIRVLRKWSEENEKLSLVDKENTKKFIADLMHAPYFIVQLNPQMTVKEVLEDGDGFEDYFGLPYNSFILDFPPMDDLRDVVRAPLLFCRVIKQDAGLSMYVQDLRLFGDFNQEKIAKNLFSDSRINATYGAPSPEEQLEIVKKVIDVHPFMIKSFVMKMEKNDHKNSFQVMLNVADNFFCNYSEHFQEKNFGLSDVWPYFSGCHTTHWCKGHADEYCVAFLKHCQSIWAYVFYTLVYINHPANIILEERPILTDREKRLAVKNKKPNALNLKKPCLLIMSHDDIVKFVRDKQSGNGHHASPITHLRRAHLRILRDPRYKKNAGKKVWVRNSVVNEGLTIQEGNTIYKVVEPPSKKRFYSQA